MLVIHIIGWAAKRNAAMQACGRHRRRSRDEQRLALHNKISSQFLSSVTRLSVHYQPKLDRRLTQALGPPWCEPVEQVRAVRVHQSAPMEFTAVWTLRCLLCSTISRTAASYWKGAREHIGEDRAAGRPGQAEGGAGYLPCHHAPLRQGWAGQVRGALWWTGWWPL